MYSPLRGLQTLHSNCSARPSKRNADVSVCFVENPERNPDPEKVKEEKVHPEVHEVAGIKIRIATQPFRCESHESWHSELPIAEHSLYLLVTHHRRFLPWPRRSPRTTVFHHCPCTLSTHIYTQPMVRPRKPSTVPS